MQVVPRSNKQPDIGRDQFHLLIFNILRQNRELLLHDAILPFVAESSLTLGSELVFKAVPIIVETGCEQDISRLDGVLIARRNG